MAEGSVDVAVSIEKIVHDTVRKVVNQIAADHGIRVISVAVDWQFALGAPAEAYKIRIETETT